MTRQSDPFAHAEHTAGRWLAVVAGELGTTDMQYTHRVLRAWLHAVRDRLTVDSAAHLGAQLPELLRGLYYEGWRPSHVPVRYDVDEFTERFAKQAGCSPADAGPAAGSVSTALNGLFSAGQLEHALAQLPKPLRTVLLPAQPDTAAASPVRTNGKTDTGARLRRLEHSVELLTQAVTELAHGLERSPLDEPDQERGAQAARTVHQLLLTRNETG